VPGNEGSAPGAPIISASGHRAGPSCRRLLLRVQIRSGLKKLSVRRHPGSCLRKVIIALVRGARAACKNSSESVRRLSGPLNQPVHLSLFSGRTSCINVSPPVSRRYCRIAAAWKILKAGKWQAPSHDERRLWSKGLPELGRFRKCVRPRRPPSLRREGAQQRRSGADDCYSWSWSEPDRGARHAIDYVGSLQCRRVQHLRVIAEQSWQGWILRTAIGGLVGRCDAVERRMIVGRGSLVSRRDRCLGPTTAQGKASAALGRRRRWY